MRCVLLFLPFFDVSPAQQKVNVWISRGEVSLWKWVGKEGGEIHVGCKARALEARFDPFHPQQQSKFIFINRANFLHTWMFINISRLCAPSTLDNINSGLNNHNTFEISIERCEEKTRWDLNSLLNLPSHHRLPPRIQTSKSTRSHTSRFSI